jgi:hypothetical protein
VVVAPASFRPHLAVTPLPLHNGFDSLNRRGLAPPRKHACPAYYISDPIRGQSNIDKMCIRVRALPWAMELINKKN